MGQIKSALEIALEKTSGVKSDRNGIEQHDAKQRGKKTANEYLADPQTSIAEALKACPKEQIESFKQGLFEALVAQICLPANEADGKRLENAAAGLQTVIANKQFAEMLNQFSQIIEQYREEMAHFEQAIRAQYAPTLRKKEEELSRRMGREVRIDPLQDPEFAAIYAQNINSLKANYQLAVDQVRGQAKELFAGNN